MPAALLLHAWFFRILERPPLIALPPRQARGRHFPTLEAVDDAFREHRHSCAVEWSTAPQINTNLRCREPRDKLKAGPRDKSRHCIAPLPQWGEQWEEEEGYPYPKKPLSL